ncbi:MAG: hypothetical protein GX754_04945 [Clostridiaceae bacterium]|nr:hypothetical protein [Clostridiaceae bacterium]
MNTAGMAAGIAAGMADKYGRYDGLVLQVWWMSTPGMTDGVQQAWQMGMEEIKAKEKRQFVIKIIW